MRSSLRSSSRITSLHTKPTNTFLYVFLTVLNHQQDLKEKRKYRARRITHGEWNKGRTLRSYHLLGLLTFSPYLSLAACNYLPLRTEATLASVRYRPSACQVVSSYAWSLFHINKSTVFTSDSSSLSLGSVIDSSWWLETITKKTKLESKEQERERERWSPVQKGSNFMQRQSNHL